LTAFLAILGALATPTAEAEPPVRVANTPVLGEHYLEVNREPVHYAGDKRRSARSRNLSTCHW
jgi:hypothetical protein